MGEAWERKEDEEKLPGVWHQGAMGAVQGCWIRVSGEACERLGRGMGEAWEQHGSRMGAAWESHGSSMGVAWERHGSSMGVAWEHSMGVAWEWHGSSMGVAWEQHGSGMGKAFKRHEVLVALLPRVHPRSRNDLQGGWHSWWRFYPCAPSEPKRPAGWVAQLVRKGIQEINIVGDSHQRVLSFHLRYLLSGFADERMVRSHEDMNFTVTDERSSKVLRINFYWVDGIYRNREYGCSLRGQYTHNYHTFPNISTTANVTVIEGGYWAGKWCAEPLQALRARLPEFFIWALLAARSNRARVVFRTPPPVPNAGSHCLDYAIKRGFAGPATNLYLAAANRHARQLAASVTRGAEMAVFDSWAVEAPRYGDTCPGDHHYSCFLGGQKRTKPVVRGAVGDAVARTFLHFLLHSLRMEDSSTAEEQNNT
ncbi:unnamed protein product [Closterium sp. NIES-65]|nr:unnamed protein product [Closterium sp. NIES-65]